MLKEKNLAAGLSWGSFSDASPLRQRIFFTLIALVVYRLASYIPLSGVNPQVMMDFTRQNGTGFLGMIDMFSGGAVGRATIMALNIVPYITASIMIQLLSVIFPYFESLRKEGGAGRAKLNQYTRYLTVFLASVEGYAIAVGLENVSMGSEALVLLPGIFFRLTTVVTLVGATLFLVWLGEQITSRGIGTGSSVIIYAGIVANLPQAAFRTLELGRAGSLNLFVLFCVLVLTGLSFMFVVFVERACRKVSVQYPKRQVGRSVTESGGSYLPIKLNTAGVLPPIFASSILMLPSLASGFVSRDASGWAAAAASIFSHGHPVFIACYVALIVFFSFFYTSIVFDPQETANNLKKNHGFVPGYKPGKMTADYFDKLLTRLTVVGSGYLAVICVLPEIVMSQVSLSFFFSGTSILILASVTLDTMSQVQTHLFSHHYQKLINRQNVRLRR